jgi:uncharacterized protein (DUF1330 family)
MKVENAVVPSPEQLEGFAQPGPEGPICMVNLLRFKDKAEYEDGRETDLGGREAYALYAQAVFELLAEFGGGGMFVADIERLMLGEVEDLWDEVAIAQYPSRQAMLDMIMSPRYQEISVHRSAGLAGQLNLETVGASGLWLDGKPLGQ